MDMGFRRISRGVGNVYLTEQICFWSDSHNQIGRGSLYKRWGVVGVVGREVYMVTMSELV